MTTVQELIREGHTKIEYQLAFRTWNGSSYEWTDYSSRLYSFGNINLQIEERAYPNAFKLTMNELRMYNHDGFFTDIDTLDGLLVNASEPYGKAFYKRMLRLTAKRYTKAGSTINTVLFVGLVEDVGFIEDGQIAILSIISLDARAADQKCDGDTAERHPLGSSDMASPSSWTAAAPGTPTGEVALYRYRHKDDNDDNYSFGWFGFRRIADVIKRTCWALDDLAYDIDDDTILYTSDGREIASVRNIPPDNEGISDGTGDNRTRAIVWNPARSVLVCGIGGKLYDYDPINNTYTLTRTISTTRQVVRLWYTTEADDGGKNQRIIAMVLDISAWHDDPSAHNYLTYVHVFDASGTGTYTELAADAISDIFPGEYVFRPAIELSGLWYVGCGDAQNDGENAYLLFRQRVAYAWDIGATCYSRLKHQDNWPGWDAIWDKGSAGAGTVLPETFSRGWATSDHSDFYNPSNVELIYSFGSFPLACLNEYNSGGRLYFITWNDYTNKYRLRYFNLYNYSWGSYLALTNSALTPLYLFSSGPNQLNPENIYLTSVLWNGTYPNPSTGYVERYDLSGSSWTTVNWLSGATGDDQYWQCMEITRLTSKAPAIIFNRKTLEWAFVSDIAGTWAGTEAEIRLRTNNMLRGLHFVDNQTPYKIFLTEYGSAGFKLHSWNGTTFVNENQTPDGAQWPVNTDIGIGAYMTHTPANYPDSNTPKGIIFGISANDFRDPAATHPAGEYVLWQYANFFAGFLKLLYLEGLSFQELRNQLAEMIGFVHYYDHDGTFKFQPRSQTVGTPDVIFSAANRNFESATISTQGWNRIINWVRVIPYEQEIETRSSEIIKGQSGSESSGILTEVQIIENTLNMKKWRVVFTGPKTFDLYILYGWGADPDTPRVSNLSIDDINRGLDMNDPYCEQISFFPEYWDGEFVEGDNFTFWVYPVEKKLSQLDYRDQVIHSDTTSILAYKRASAEYDNRFVNKQLAPDYAAAILAWRKDPHPIINVKAVFDSTIQPLQIVQLLDSGLGYTASDDFMVAGISINQEAVLMAVTLIKL